MRLFIKSSTGEKGDVEVESTDSTVSQLMTAVEQMLGVPKERQKLVYKGRVMNKEESTLESYGINEDDTVYMVKGAAAAASSSGAAGSAAPTSTSAPAPASTASTTSPGMGMGMDE